LPGAPVIASLRYCRTLNDPDTLRGFVRHLPMGIYISNAAGEVLDANPACLELFGVESVEALRSINAKDLFVDPAQREIELEFLEAHGSVRDFELQFIRPDGELRTVLDTTYLCRDEATNEMFYHGTLVDITRRKELELQLRDLSTRDPLTGAYNRRYLTEVEASLGEQHVGSWGCVYMDVDHFKQFNDERGHQAGDEALIAICTLLGNQAEGRGEVVRMGGDEFVLLLPGFDRDATEVVAAAITAAGLSPDGGVGVAIGFSCGYAARDGNEPLERTIHRADQHMLAERYERALAARVL